MMPWHTESDHGQCPAGKPYAVVQDSDSHVMGCHATEEDAKKQMAALYANEPMMRAADEAPPSLYVETRTATLENVDSNKRVITLIAAPYEQPAMVDYRGETWKEIFLRTAWASVMSGAAHRVRVNREHNPNLVCGKAVKFYDRPEGLVADLRIAKTHLGDEALVLADEGCLSASVGFGASRDDCEFDRRTMTRRIKRAYLDHIALVQSPAYIGAEVLSVREAPTFTVPPTRVATPDLDAAIHDDMLRWAEERLNRQ